MERMKHSLNQSSNVTGNHKSMNALAQAYDSDSSNSNEFQGNGAIGGILAAYEDSDTDDERVEKQSPSTQEDNNQDSKEKRSVHFSKIKRRDTSSMGKEDDSVVRQEVPTIGLPNPILLEASSTAQHLFPKNYLHGKKLYQDMNVKLNSTLLKLQQDDGSFAQHLKQQKEFGNKSIFPGIIEHFKINPMGSNVDENIFESFEYIERLLVKEEENRIRMTEE